MTLNDIMIKEHVHIMKVIVAIKREIEDIKKTRKVDVGFIDTVVDFIRSYADKTHHGKEEDILFRMLASKPMVEKERHMMVELLDEHVLARQIIAELMDATKKYLDGEDTVNIILEKLETLVELYPDHINKENNTFFPDSDKYFTEEEQASMLAEGQAFDEKMEPDKYVAISKELHKR